MFVAFGDRTTPPEKITVPGIPIAPTCTGKLLTAPKGEPMIVYT